MLAWPKRIRGQTLSMQIVIVYGYKFIRRPKRLLPITVNIP